MYYLQEGTQFQPASLKGQPFAMQTKECDDEWAFAREICEQYFDSPDRQRGLHGKNLDECIRSQVSEACGGNPT